VVKIDKNGKKAISSRKFPAGTGIFALFSTKIPTWTMMPPKGHIIGTFRGLLSDKSVTRLEYAVYL